MDDQQTWQRALRAIDDWHRGLSEECRTQLGELIGRIMLLKEESLRLGLAAGSAEICRTCGGSCCRYGKYHVTILDLLAFRLNSIDPIANFDNFPFCPYGGDEGCLMPPFQAVDLRDLQLRSDRRAHGGRRLPVGRYP